MKLKFQLKFMENEGMKWEIKKEVFPKTILWRDNSM